MLTYNLEVVVLPVAHRNTIGFIGMAERTYYLTYKKTADYFFALDKDNFINQWDVQTGRLLHKTRIANSDYSLFEMDRDVYDRDWFTFSVITKPHVEASLNANVSQQYIEVKVVELSEKGFLTEHLSFVHPKKRDQELHLYFSKDFTKMIELVVSTDKKQSFTTYNLYKRSGNSWDFQQTLDESIAWHQKTLYPFNLNQETFDTVLKHESIPYDTFKIEDNRIKALNNQDGIEIVYNAETGKQEGFVALQYKLQNSKEAFYDRRTGQLFVQEVLLRL
jgi:hypothetical protein